MKRYEKHLFICENGREPGHPRGCCASKNGAAVKEKFKTRLKELNLSPIIRANSAGCLDACEFGPVVVIYPEQVWYGGVKEEDVEEIIQEHIIKNKVVERLTIKDQRYNKDA